MNISERFGALAPAGGGAWPALRLAGAESHYLAKGSAGEPVFLLKVLRRRVPRIPLGPRHVQVEFEVDCAVRDTNDAEGGPVSATFCRVVCDPAAPGLHPLFVNALGGAGEGLPPELSPAETDRFFDDAVELFRLFAAPARNSVLGLWGELFVIAASPCPDALVTGWHVIPVAARTCVSAVRFSLDIDRAPLVQEVPAETVWLATASSTVR